MNTVEVAEAKVIPGYKIHRKFGVYVSEDVNNSDQIYRRSRNGEFVEIEQYKCSLTNYMMVEIRGIRVPVHQIIFAALKPEEFKTGREQELDIVHLDKNNENNKITNLTMMQRCENQKRFKMSKIEITAYNIETSERKTFKSMTDAALYLNTKRDSIQEFVNSNKSFKGFILTTNRQKQKHLYIVDGYVFKTLAKLGKYINLSPGYLATLFNNKNYGDRLAINEFFIERITKPYENDTASEIHKWNSLEAVANSQENELEVLISENQ